MKFSNKIKLSLFTLLIILNIILRLQVVSNEIGLDSFLVHMMANSVSEFGYAKWVLHPNSFFGMYPYSEVSAVPFFLSGIFQSTGMEMRWVIFLYNIFLGILSLFATYLFAGAIIDDDVFKFLASFAFSTSPAILDFSTWTIPARGLFVVLVPLLMYMLLKCRGYIRCIPLIIFFGVFLYATHHMFYFLLPVFIAFFVLLILFKFKDYINLIKIPATFTPLIPLAGFFLMFSIPFITGKFIEESRYSPIYESYVRYVGILIIPAFGGLIYVVFKSNKNFGEWFLLLSVIFITALIYEQTYMKGFLPIFAIVFACIGLINMLRLENRRHVPVIISMFLLISLSFSGYYQFLRYSPTNERYIEDSTYTAGRWMREYLVGSGITNDRYFGVRIGAVSENAHFLTPFVLPDFIYGFIAINLSEFKWYPITSEEFWFDVGESKREAGEESWESLNMLYAKHSDFNITYFAENTKTGGNLIWHHGMYPSKLLQQAYNESYLLYDGGKVRVWNLE